jgi:hypothetical protein
VCGFTITCHDVVLLVREPVEASRFVVLPLFLKGHEASALYPSLLPGLLHLQPLTDKKAKRNVEEIVGI